MFEVHRVVDAKNLLVNCSTYKKNMFKDVESVYLFVN